jgi:hypothetical protein
VGIVRHYAIKAIYWARVMHKDKGVMEHLQEAQIIEEIWGGAQLSGAERDHLALCGECQRHFAALKQLHEELQIARRSIVLPEIEARYLAAFAQSPTAQRTIQSANPEKHMRNIFGSLTEWMAALPLWDSRKQTATIGLRNANSSSYRMLFGVDTTEVELMVEPQGGLLRVVGEVMTGSEEEMSGLALVELMVAQDARLAKETESDANGRFHFEGVLPGTYILTITPRYRPSLVIESLELT